MLTYDFWGERNEGKLLTTITQEIYMRSLLQSSKKRFMIIAAGALLSAVNLQSQFAEPVTAAIILPQVVQLAAAVLYRAAITPHHQQQAQFTQAPSSASYSFPSYGSSTASDPLGAIRYSGIQNLRQNREVFGLLEGYKTQFPPCAHGPAYKHIGSGFNVPHEHNPSQPASPTTPDFSIPIPQGFGLPQLPNFFSQPSIPHINIPHIQGEFRIAPPDIGPRDTGFSVALNVRRNVPMATSADYIVHVEDDAHIFNMKSIPGYFKAYAQAARDISNILWTSNSDLQDFGNFITHRLEVVQNCYEYLYQYANHNHYGQDIIKGFNSSPMGINLENALYDLINIYFNDEG